MKLELGLVVEGVVEEEDGVEEEEEELWVGMEEEVEEEEAIGVEEEVICNFSTTAYNSIINWG